MGEESLFESRQAGPEGQAGGCFDVASWVELEGSPSYFQNLSFDGSFLF